MSDLAELLERVKAATGPDRRLDLDICAALDLLEYGMTSRGYTRFPHPELTASLDASLALAERVLDTAFIDIEVAKRFVASEPYARAEICGPEVNSYAQAATPPLALLAALLSALAAQKSVGSVYPKP